MGRLASNVAKAALQGQKVIVVRCEEILISGPQKRNLGIFTRFLNKTQITNPRRGPFHHRNPSSIFLRKVRGMLPYKTSRGAAALDSIQVFEGIPAQFAKKKRVIVTNALRLTNIKAESPVTRLGDLAAKVGWKYGPVVAEMEEKRKVESRAHYKKQLKKKSLWTEAVKASESNAEFTKVVNQLAAYGY